MKDRQRLELYQQGLNDREIAERLGTHPNTILRWRQRRKPSAHDAKVDPGEVRRLHTQGLNDTQIAHIFKVDPSSISYHRRKMELPSNRKLDPETIRHSWKKGLSNKQIANKLGVDRSTIYYHLRKMGLPANRQRRPSKVNPEDVRRLHMQGIGDTQIASVLGVTRSVIRYCRQQMGLPCIIKCAKSQPFTEDEVHRLKEMAQEGHSTREMATALGRSRKTTYQKLRLSGIPFQRQSRYPVEYWNRQYMEKHVPIIEDYLRDPGQPWKTIAREHDVTVKRVQTIVGQHLMKKCREAESCAYRALLPEHKTQEKKT